MNNEEKDQITAAPVEAVEEIEAVVDKEKEEITIATSKNLPVDKKGGKRSFRRSSFRLEKKDEFEQRILDIARVTRVMAGGKRMRFRACVAVGDRKGKIGIGVGKGADVTLAVNKAVNKAKKDMFEVPLVNDTIPHYVHHKYCAAKILFKPAQKGRGVIAGGVIRTVLELAGVKNISAKALGSGNKISNARCTLEAMKKLKRVEAPKAENQANGKKEEKTEEKNNKKANKE